MRTAKLLVRPRKIAASTDIKQAIMDCPTAEYVISQNVSSIDSTLSIDEQSSHITENITPVSIEEQSATEQAMLSDNQTEMDQNDKPLDLSEVGVEITNDENLDSPVCYAENCGRSADQY